MLPRVIVLRQRAASPPSPVGFPAAQELQVQGGTQRSIVSVKGGWLAAVDRGEFEGTGLYLARAGSPKVQRLDAALLWPIRWVGASSSLGVVAVAGGGSCGLQTAVYEVVEVDEAPGWKLDPVALVPDSAAVTVSTSDSSSVLIAGCDALYRVSRAPAKASETTVATVDAATPASGTAVTRLGSWPSGFIPLELSTSGTADAASYHVSFGHVAARFSADGAQWFAPSHCPHLTRGSKNECRCTER